MANISIEKLEQLAEQDFSNFEPEFENYTGESDDFMDFGGAPGASFMNPAARAFTITIQNANSAARTVYLTPGLVYAPGIVNSASFNDTTKAVTLNSPNGYLKTGAILDKDGNSGLTVSATGSKTVEEFLAFIYTNPTAVTYVKVRTSASDGAQLANKITVRPQSPFRDLGSYDLNPEEMLDQNSQQTNVALFQTPGLILSKDMQLQLTIAGSQVTTITFGIGGILNNSAALQKKAGRAAKVMGK